MKKSITTLALALSIGACAQNPPAAMNQPAAPVFYYDTEEALFWLQNAAQKHGLNAENWRQMLRETPRDDGVLRRISRPAEKSKPWHEYRLIFADEARLQGGVDFYRQHEALLQAASMKYGVDPHIIVAILGVETRYGQITGKTSVLSALATLCFDYPPRAKFFCEELNYFFRLSEREGWDAKQIQGSYAGAMGMAQFMPSSYFNDAVDGDGDGRVTLWDSPADAIFSIAHYLHKRGWQAHSVDYVKRLPNRGGLVHFGKEVKPYFLAQDVQTALIHDADLMEWLKARGKEKLGSLVLTEENGESYWLTHHNFYVITRYNTSPMYAMAVVNLAQSIRDRIKQP